MKKSRLKENVKKNKDSTRDCLQTLFDSINKGQQKQIIKNEKIKEMFDRYKVEY